MGYEEKEESLLLGLSMTEMVFAKLLNCCFLIPQKHKIGKAAACVVQVDRRAWRWRMKQEPS